MGWFRAFERDGKELAELAKTPLTMPMLVLSGAKAGGEFLIEQGRLVDNNVEGVVVKGSGHWPMEEARDQVIPALVALLTKSGIARSRRQATVLMRTSRSGHSSARDTL